MRRINLKLTDIDWKKDEICILQRKTGQTLVLPLEADTGKAIADYILSGRPNADSPYIFVRSVAPYTKLSDSGNGRNIIKKYCDSAGINHLPGDGKGFHALRRSMGTWMLEAGVALPTISQVLGHHDHDSTKQYLSLDYLMLVECALSNNRHDFLGFFCKVFCTQVHFCKVIFDLYYHACYFFYAFMGFGYGFYRFLQLLFSFYL
ncbi:hypothetical protein C4588_07975 [Candidatus Parcubacteria bacterium]|nr:MAG: hypothetical protein C4588_07975 [Candidatus Parcubacteria bacterium]